jgi:sugar phosphate isomerase/epimerase
MTLPPDFGLPTQIFADLPLDAALERLAPLTDLVEIDSFGFHTVLSPRNRRIAHSSGLRFTVHGPYGPDILPGSLDERLRRAAVAAHRRHLEAAAEIGATLYVVHPDYCHPPSQRDPAVIAALQRTISDLEEAQRQTGVRIALENMPGVISTWASSGLCSIPAMRPSATDWARFCGSHGLAWSTCICTTTAVLPMPAIPTLCLGRVWWT